MQDYHYTKRALIVKYTMEMNQMNTGLSLLLLGLPRKAAARVGIF